MTDRLEFIANLCDRQSALMLSGKGDRCLVELEAFGINAALAHVGMAKFAGRNFRVIVEEVPENWTKLDDEAQQADQRPEKRVTRLGRRRS